MITVWYPRKDHRQDALHSVLLIREITRYASSHPLLLANQDGLTPCTLQAVSN